MTVTIDLGWFIAWFIYMAGFFYVCGCLDGYDCTRREGSLRIFGWTVKKEKK